MAKEYIRTYKEWDFNEIQKQILILGDLTATCGACQEIGLKTDEVQCPHCGTYFRFATSRRLESHPGERFKLAKKVLEQRPDFVFIDYADYQKILGQKKVRDIFG